jgi:pimeloyl-ACP methyl ester carboxylesterase
VELAYIQRGEGAAVVLLRQLEKPLWGPVIERLARVRKVFAVDLPGMGQSPTLPGGETPTIEALAGATAAWFRGVGLERPQVVGNSLGGAVAVELARTREVRSSVAISPIGLWTRWEAAYALGSLRIARKIARKLGERATLIAASSAGRTLAFGQLMARPRQIPPNMAEAMLRGLAEAPGFDTTRRAVTHYRMTGFESDVPVTIAWARRDLMTPPHQARRAKRILPHARHVSLPGCGHSPMAEDPDSVVRVVLESGGA